MRKCENARASLGKKKTKNKTTPSHSPGRRPRRHRVLFPIPGFVRNDDYEDEEIALSRINVKFKNKRL